MAITFKPFDAKTVQLEGINLIEASAGTGKTYSIALLVLRLIIEKEIPVKEILMVTFTKAAVAELEERIRLFVRNAYKQAQNQQLQSDDIGKLLAVAIQKSSHQNITDLLKNAVLFLDETSVLTIHSFCQLTLNEFAFETQQLFGAELVQDTSAILQDEVNEFWRQKVTCIDTQLLTLLIAQGLSRENLGKVVKEHLSGKKFFVYEDGVEFTLNEADILANIKVLEQENERLKVEFYQFIEDNKNRLWSISQVKDAKKSILKLYVENDVADWLRLISNPKTIYPKALYPDILEKLAIRKIEEQAPTKFIKQIINKITCNAINQVGNGINAYKLRNNQLSFDDLIYNLNKAILKPNNSKLTEGLQSKYKAVFIDEFQDTDRLQYQIFDTAFNTNTVVFYIGDPKQSIYAWRKADIFTYFEAQKAADNCYSMNHNFRSSANYIAAMNAFFEPIENFDAFHFKGNEQTIDYVKVDSPNPNTKGNLLNYTQPESPITLTSLKNKTIIAEAVANQISELLKNNSPFGILNEAKNPNTCPIKPSDIGILVRSKKDGLSIQAQLTKLGIPSIAITEAKILQSAEAQHILYFLMAVADISRANINRALLSPFTGYGKTQILSLDMQQTTQLFRKYKALWQSDGIFTTIKTFMADYQTVSQLSQQNAHQTLTNLQHITELLHKTQTSKKLSDLDIINWLNRGINGEENEGDEYQKRIESDDEAVKIVTIHSSKGLEYNIVFAPYLDFMLARKHTHKATRICTIRNPETKIYQSFTNYDALNAEEKIIHDQQEKQENSRLIYVSITRAVYKCFIYSTNTKDSPLVYFTDALQNPNPNLITQTTHYPLATNYLPLTTNHSPLTTYHLPLTTNHSPLTTNHPPQTTNPTPVNFQLLEKNWHKLSYSFLKAAYINYPTIKSNQTPNPYDNFIFNDLAKGAKTGNMLHYIFENIQLDNPKTWPQAINKALKNFTTKETDNYKTKLLELLQHSLNTTLNIDGQSFTLSAVNAKKCINELEFDFMVSPFKIPQLKALEDENTQINLRPGNNLEGVMNGKIDLFFEHQGKYYVLDWKSNYLGNHVENYNNDGLNQAMNHNNYHLQYLIYTLAAKKYLESRLPNFNYQTQFGGVIYLFVRGLRTGQQTGIFIAKPSAKKIQLLDSVLSNNFLVKM